MRDNRLGWDVTDYGLGRFYEIGLVLFTLRNGSLKNKKYSKPYAEKLLISEEGQICPKHFHYSKMEDIINHGGGNLVMRVRNSEPGGMLSPRPVEIVTDGLAEPLMPEANLSWNPE